MIESFKCKHTERLFNQERVPRFQSFEKSARNKLRLLSRAKSLSDLAAVPSLRPERLQGDRLGQHGIRINDQWRICFKWRSTGVFDVEVVDYH
jgi:proteic killer suppression protein